ncbi:nicotinate-nucleotide--dimethylbenzimidazole phosphoribosyltransferase [Ideonella sp. DXS22W]|uniref:Nicotinate-nucleotide--dimethylbenzimidazole phosphoribosyltransferase n=1 Tax=Pseudaquabacterium inlustre TaxID=2984192 RepID=A0ABU9CPE9_9BURK
MNHAIPADDLPADLAALCARITPRGAEAQPALAARLRHRIDHLTKPLGALGRLESLMLQIGLLQGREHPALRAPQLLVFAADHGIAAQGVSAYPQAVTAQMVANMRGGGAAINVLARQHGLAWTLVDAGIASAPPAGPDLVDARLGAGSDDAATGPALGRERALEGLRRGAALVAARPGNAVVLGEMGIANTSAAALLLAALAGTPLDQAVGRGTGLDDAGLAHKRAVLQRALDRVGVAPGRFSPVQALAEFGGFEIAMMAGAMLQAAAEHRLVLVDGFIAGAAALVARGLAPSLAEACVFGHRGAEAGHAAMLQALGAEPLLDLGLRLGEGSGAALAWPLVASAVELLAGMASFDSAGVSGPSET